MVAQLNPISPITGSVLGARAVTGNITANADQTVNADSTGGAFTVTLPAPGSYGDATVVLIRDTGGACATNPVTVAASGGQTIDGAASVQLAINRGVLCVARDGERDCWTLCVPPMQLQGSGQSLTRLRDIGAAPGAVTGAAPGTSGNVLMSNGKQWVSATLSTGWQTLLDLDFTAQANQTLTGDGNFTIGGKVWQKSNSANEAAAMALVNGTGLQIKAHAGLYGAVRAAPVIWLPFSQIAPSSNFTLMSAVRIWVYVASVTGAPGNGDALFCGLDTNNNNYKIWQGWNFPVGLPTLQLTMGRALNGVQSNAATSGGQGNQDIGATKMILLHTDRLFPIGAPAMWLSRAADAAAGWPDEQTGVTPFFAEDATTAFALAGASLLPPVNLLTGYGIALGAAGVGGDPVYTVARIRVDFRP